MLQDDDRGLSRWLASRACGICWRRKAQQQGVIMDTAVSTKLYGYLIDPFKRTVTEVPYSGDYTQIYGYIDCECFDIARVNAKGDGIFVDDEGLISGKPQAFFRIDGYPQPLAGKGLYMGSDREGETVSPYATLEEVRKRITWVMPIRMGSNILWLDC